MSATVQEGEIERVRALLEAGADVAQAQQDGWTALMLASKEGHAERVRALLEAGADVAQADADGATALISASVQGHVECVRALLEAGADVAKAAEDGWTALILASANGNFECVRALLEAGADVAQAAANGQTALMRANFEGHLGCVRALLEAGAAVAQAAANGQTALLASSQAGHHECVRALLEAGADVAQASANGVTALMFASRHGHLECARALLEAGAAVMQVNRAGHCALDLAAIESLEVLQLLCAYAPSGLAARAHIAHCTPQHLVSRKCARWLVATRRWTSPLHHFEFLPLERVRALLVEGADVHGGDGEADAPTPLSLAAARLLQGDGSRAYGRAALIVRAAAPWSPGSHALFPAAAKARAVELVRIGWLLARRVQSLAAGNAHVEVALRDVWLGHVMPRAVARTTV